MPGATIEPSTRRPLTLGEAASLLSMVGAYLYGLGWVFYSFLFRELGVQPEDAGIDLRYLFVRSVLSLGMVLSLFFVLLTALGFFGIYRRGREGRLTLFHTALTLISTTVFVCLAGSLYLLLHYSGKSRTISLTIGLPVGAAVAITFFWSTLIAFGYRATGRGVRLHAMSPSHTVAAGALVLLVVMAVSAAAGAAVGRRVRSGQPIVNFAISIPSVKVVSAPTFADPSILVQLCPILRLGQHGDTVLLYAATKRLLVSVSSMTTTILAQPSGAPYEKC